MKSKSFVIVTNRNVAKNIVNVIKTKSHAVLNVGAKTVIIHMELHLMLQKKKFPATQN
jgi:hypothetical protein